jgi:hypothetical protein
MGNIAIERNYKFSVWVHSDVYVMPMNQSMTVRQTILDAIARFSRYELLSCLTYLVAFNQYRFILSEQDGS